MIQFALKNTDISRPHWKIQTWAWL